jgi:conjugal transfer pilus assembly protein TraU
MQTGDMDIAYLSEVDPMWNDSTLSMIINPEAALFGNLIAQAACAADAAASSAGLPLSPLFWCAGAQGSMYPFTGYTSGEFSPLESSLLVSERMAYKLHREGLVMNSVGADTAVCFQYPSPIIPKERWRYQMVNMYPETSSCHPFGASTQLWGTTTTPSVQKEFWLSDVAQTQLRLSVGTDHEYTPFSGPVRQWPALKHVRFFRQRSGCR